MRTLLNVPAIHTPEEASDGDPGFRARIADVLGESDLTGLEEATHVFWHEAARRLVAWMAKERMFVHIFVDGVPDVRDGLGMPARMSMRPPGPEASWMSRIIWAMAKNGARLHGTEDPTLIRELSEFVSGGHPVSDNRGDPRGPWLVHARDEYIARNILRTVPDGHYGILFLGAAHKAHLCLAELDPAFRIIQVIENPVTGETATPLL